MEWVCSFDSFQLSVIQEEVRDWRRDLILFTQDLMKVEDLLRTEVHVHDCMCCHGYMYICAHMIACTFGNFNRRIFTCTLYSTFILYM